MDEEVEAMRIEETYEHKADRTVNMCEEVQR
jgi:hypothetical protein